MYLAGVAQHKLLNKHTGGIAGEIPQTVKPGMASLQSDQGLCC